MSSNFNIFTVYGMLTTNQKPRYKEIAVD